MGRALSFILTGSLAGCSLIFSVDDLVTRTPDGGAPDGPPSSDAGIAYVQSRSTHDVGAAKMDWTTMLPLASPVRQHDALVVGVVAFQVGQPIAMITASDDRGDTFTAMTNILGYDNYPNEVILAAFDVAGGATTVTIAMKGPAIEGTDAFVLEYAGIRSLETFAGQGGGKMGLDGVTSGQAMTSAPLSMLVGVAYTDGMLAPGTDFTRRETSMRALVEDRLVDAGPHEATATMDEAGVYWVMQMAAFK